MHGESTCLSFYAKAEYINLIVLRCISPVDVVHISLSTVEFLKRLYVILVRLDWHNVRDYKSLEFWFSLRHFNMF